MAILKSSIQKKCIFVLVFGLGVHPNLALGASVQFPGDKSARHGSLHDLIIVARKSISGWRRRLGHWLSDKLLNSAYNIRVFLNCLA